MKIEAAIPLALLGAVCWSGTAAAQSRAENNYQRLLNGQVQWPSLSPAEREEVIGLDRLLRSIPADKRSASERCWRQEVGDRGKPSPLGRELIELRCGGPFPRDETEGSDGTAAPATEQ